MNIRNTLYFVAACVSLALSCESAIALPAQSPLYLVTPTTPVMMLNLSKDHQLYFKAYDDYSDLTDSNGGDPDGIPDTTYVNKYKYYGYFDSAKCYRYDATNNYFIPNSMADSSGYCSSSAQEWSGNFLNWATMTRLDAVRKILYGGKRSIDTSDTVLERAFLPRDAHSFAKYYNGADINKLTPFTVTNSQNTVTSGITLCNTTLPDGVHTYSQDTTSPPSFYIVSGNYSLWGSSPQVQCGFGTSTALKNNNNSTLSGIQANPGNPTNSDFLGSGASPGLFTVRVKVCVDGMLESNCQKYPTATKPVGLLQKFGETSLINFGLMTGSYGANKSGGVLRKNVGNMLNEIATTTDGHFITPTGGSIIGTIDKLRAYGYDMSGNGVGYGGYGGDKCTYQLTSFTNGQCTNWGNPQSEIYLESLRYLSGQTSPTSAFTVDTNSINTKMGLTNATWSPPVTNANYCAPLSVIQFNTSSTSYDTDDTDSATVSDLGLSNVAALKAQTDAVSLLEGITNTNRFVGQIIGGSGDQLNQLCTAKNISALSLVSGLCSDAPAIEGGYNIAGLAYYARHNGIPLRNVSGRNSATVRTYGVALNTATPKIKVMVPNSSNFITIQPACRNTKNAIATSCAIVDMKITQQNFGVTLSGYTGDYAFLNGQIANTGKLYIDWEDSMQGSDFDQDMWGVLNYVVTGNKVLITTQVVDQSSTGVMGFGYVITGTDHDGFQVHSGINNFQYDNSANGFVGCTLNAGSQCTCLATGVTDGTCNVTGSAARSQLYNITNATISRLPSPLELAAKWGGYSNDFERNLRQTLGANYNSGSLDNAIKTRDISDSFFYATNPTQLEASLAAAFRSVADSIGSSSSVATNSARLSEGSYVYQAQFNSAKWNGAIYAFGWDNNGNLQSTPSILSTSGNGMQKTDQGRTIYTYNRTALTSFDWNNLNSSQQASLVDTGETNTTNAQARVSWIKGSYAGEVDNGFLRNRGRDSSRNILGDIVNSSPAYFGGYDFRYSQLPGSAGSSYGAYLLSKQQKTPKLFAGANDGMLHAFNASTLSELWAYIPSMVYPQMLKYSKPTYGSSSNPHQYSVDGPVAVGDAYINGNWRSIVVGALGAGGKGIYALDVTDDVPKLLFEFNSTDFPEMGYIIGKIQVAPLMNGHFGVIFGNGDSSNTTSQLIIIDLDNSSHDASKIINTQTGMGLSTPALLLNSYGQVIRAYAGDLSGNLWRFNLDSSSMSDWVLAYKVFSATTSNNIVQPIFAAPTIGLNQQKNNDYMLYFGTGKYYETADNTASIATQTFYAIADIGGTVQRSSLLQKTLGSNNGIRTVSTDNPTWASQNGWYLDFDSQANLGERVNTKALLLQDKLIFPTLVPGSDPCLGGGRSYLMEVTAIGDKYTQQHLLDGIASHDYFVLGDVGFGLKGLSNSDGSIIGSGTDSSLLNSNAHVSPLSLGRQVWRQVH